MRVSEGIFVSYSTCKVRNGNFLKMRVSEICVKRIRVNQGLGVLHNDKELLALRNNFRATKKFLIAKFDCTTEMVSPRCVALVSSS